MAYHVLTDATMVLHFAFLAYVVAGGFLAWCWSPAIWPHLLAAGWGLSTLLFGLHCPLTWLEDWARRRAGGSGLSHGFIDTYLTGIVYPERYTGLLQFLVAAAVTVSWVGALRNAVTARGRLRHAGMEPNSGKDPTSKSRQANPALAVPRVSRHLAPSTKAGAR